MSQVTTGKAGIGVIARLGDGESPETFAAIGNVTNMEVGGITMNILDGTHMDSPNNHNEVIAGLKSSSLWSLTFQWDPSDATQDEVTGVRKMLIDRTLVGLQVDPSGIGITKGIEARGYFTEVGNITIAPDQVMTMSVSFQPSGAPYVVNF